MADFRNELPELGSGRDGFSYRLAPSAECFRLSNWITWAGGEMPEAVTGKRVDLRFRSGQEAKHQHPEEWIWEHYERRGGGEGHIIAYRVSKLN